jgi:hypothetical protein
MYNLEHIFTPVPRPLKMYSFHFLLIPKPQAKWKEGPSSYSYTYVLGVSATQVNENVQ